MIRIPLELSEYIDMEDGKLIELKPVPEELKDLENEFRSTWERIHSKEDLAEY